MGELGTIVFCVVTGVAVYLVVQWLSRDDGDDGYLP